jgi:hypothetical protein
MNVLQAQLISEKLVTADFSNRNLRVLSASLCGVPFSANEFVQFERELDKSCHVHTFTAVSQNLSGFSKTGGALKPYFQILG